MKNLILILIGLNVAASTALGESENKYKAFPDLSCEDGAHKFTGHFTIALSDKVVAVAISEPSATKKAHSGKSIAPVRAEATIMRSAESHAIQIKDTTVILNSAEARTTCTFKDESDVLELQQMLGQQRRTAASL